MHPRTSPDMAAYVDPPGLHTRATTYGIGAFAAQQRPVMLLTVIWPVGVGSCIDSSNSLQKYCV